MNIIDFRRLAKEAGFRDHHSADMWGVMLAHDIEVERFAKLVAEAEREECAKLENMLHFHTGDAHRTYSSREVFDHMNQGIKDYAALIRARGNK